MSEGISEEKLVNAIRQSTQEVFYTMLGLEVEAMHSYIDNSAPGPTGGVVSLIGLAGRWVGMGSVTCSAEFARKASSQLLMTDFQAVDEEVLDAVAEITNMIIGNVKTAIEEDLGVLGLSIPTVIYGRNFTTALFQNTPNPFRPNRSTAIRYAVGRTSQVSLNIIDVSGYPLPAQRQEAAGKSQEIQQIGEVCSPQFGSWFKGEHFFDFPLHAQRNTRRGEHLSRL